MKFGIFYEHQLPRPWSDGDEQRILDEALDQVELADQLGIDYAWEVEHHFLEEYSHSSSPEVFLAAAAERTEDIRLGHGIRLMPPDYNHPARVAEGIATLDLISDGRVEFGTGESSSSIELGGFGIDRREKDAMWQETTEQVTNMMTMEPYPGYDGEFFEMPSRNVVPKPKQDPHPPLWVACSSRSTIEEAARRGIGALCFDFAAAENAREWVDTYYETFREECEPIGHAVNPNVAMVTGFSVHEDRQEAVDRGAEGFAFFQYALAHYYGAAPHQPGRTDVWQEFQDVGGAEAVLDGVDVEAEDTPGAIGTPDDVRQHLEALEEAGVDQVIFVQQGGNNEHEHICDSLELFAEEVMPAFHERDEAHVAEKREELEPYIEEAFERKDEMDPMDADEPPMVDP
ncbi:LLM class flavin-dependent oxidoreductase [Halomarina salina]|uniref:LLM class flavin-dependent oxidoreductase n=1 Tax=Halomarina salina TaxID=1872699 RepID=A0ABD5RRV7_9EURY|nr:LLM class flavin-dependent oxidoreductase [Halomarina salina]